MRELRTNKQGQPSYPDDAGKQYKLVQRVAISGGRLTRIVCLIEDPEAELPKIGLEALGTPGTACEHGQRSGKLTGNK